MKRRKFLKSSAHLAMLSSYSYGLQMLLNTCMKSNQVWGQPSTEMNYLNFQLPGGPPAWCFDQPLNPHNNKSDFHGGLFGTEIIQSAGKFEPVYRAYKQSFGGKEVYLPPVWRLKSAYSGEAFSGLLNNIMMVRGIDMEINSHTVNRERIVRPVTSRPSIHGLVADRSTKPLAAIGMSRTYGTNAFKSQRGLSMVGFNPARPIQDIVSSFQGRVTKAEDLSFSVTQTLEALDQYAIERGLSSQGAEKQQMAAYAMFARNLDAFSDQWDSLYKKYQAIVAAEIRAPFPGITDVNPVSDDSNYYKHAVRDTDVLSGSLKDQITSKTHINRMAQSFAFVEFAISQNISSSYSLDILSGRVMSLLKDVTFITADQHSVGVINSIYFTSLMYRALLGCILELKKFLQGNGHFDKTVIHISSEFSRTPKEDGSGSDHGFNSGTATLFSGMISTPGLVGNISKLSQKPSFLKRYPGTWGEAAPFFDNVPLTNDDLVNTLCEIFEIEKLAVKGRSLVRKNGGQVSWLKDWTVKNV